MDESKMEGIRESFSDGPGEESDKRVTASGRDWLRVSYERSDGRVQMQYIIFDSRGYVHCQFDWVVPRQAKRRFDNVFEAQRTSCGVVRFTLVRQSG